MTYNPTMFATIRKLGRLGLWETATFIASNEYDDLDIHMLDEYKNFDLFITWYYDHGPRRRSGYLTSLERGE